jgi:hypothetical protein
MQADWHKLGDVWYRKWHAYDMRWLNDIEIDDYMICGAQFGGPLALILKEEKLKALDYGQQQRKLKIYTSSGIKMAEVDWDAKQRVSGMGWSDQEQLVIVIEDGNVLIYDIQGKLVRNFLLLDVVANEHIVECHFWGNGVVAVTSEMQLYVAEVSL